MLDETMSAAFRAIRDYTAARAWAAEILAVFVLCTAGRFGLAVWMFDAALAGAGVVPGGVPAAAAGTAGAGDAEGGAVVGGVAARLRQPAVVCRERYNRGRGFRLCL